MSAFGRSAPTIARGAGAERLAFAAWRGDERPGFRETSERPRDRESGTMNVADAEKSFAKLVEKVCAEGVSIDLERDDMVIARLTPAEPDSPLTVGDLNAFLRRLPSLDDDADDFAADVRAVRSEFPAEADPWD